MERYLIHKNGRDIEKTKSLFDYLIKKYIPRWVQDFFKFLIREVSNFEIFKIIYFKILKLINDFIILFQARLSAFL